MAVHESRRLPEPIEAALYLSGRILVDAVCATARPVALTLSMSTEDVHLVVTVPADGAAAAAAGGDERENALRLLGDRLAVLGGGVTTTSLGKVSEIRCQVPLPVDLEFAR